MHQFFSPTELAVQTIVTRLFANDPTLKTVECAQLHLDSIQSKAIFTALKHSTHVKRLEFLDNRPGEAIKDLAEVIKEHKSLEEVYLGANGLGDHELFYLTASLQENLSSVQLLDVNSNQGITDKGASYIAELLKNATHIIKMEISFTSITDVGLKDIVQALENNPESSLLELCEPDLLSHGFLTRDGELIQQFTELFDMKRKAINELVL